MRSSNSSTTSESSITAPFSTAASSRASPTTPSGSFGFGRYSVYDGPEVYGSTTKLSTPGQLSDYGRTLVMAHTGPRKLASVRGPIRKPRRHIHHQIVSGLCLLSTLETTVVE